MLYGLVSDPALKALQSRIAVIDVERAALDAEKMGLLVEQGRLEAEAQMVVAEPYLVNAKWLIAKLGWSTSTFYSTVRNAAKGFPAAHYATSDPQWLWHEVRLWVHSQNSRKVLMK